MLFNFLKPKQTQIEDKQAALENRLNALNFKYSDIINSYCKVNDNVFIFRGFKIKDGNISVCYFGKDSLEGYHNIIDLDFWEMRYGDSDFDKYRVNWLKFKESLEKIGLKITTTK